VCDGASDGTDQVYSGLMLGTHIEVKAMKYVFVAAALAAAAATSAPSVASEKTRHHHRYYHAPAYTYGDPAYRGGYPVSPYGNGRPAYASPYGTYPSYTYDPDPTLRAQLRTDFNRGVDFPGNGR
jgi:hypothetical protein